MPESKEGPMVWQPRSWQQKEALQQPTYPDREAVDRVLERLAQLPPLVTSWEVETLKEQLAEAARGERFLLQGGDCAETFDDCTSPAITSKLKILLQMSLILVHGTKKRIIRVGRFAGQYAKPRSSDSETRDGTTLPSYRGDLVNRNAFTTEDRVPDPKLLLRGYERAALTLNFVRSLVDGGFADLHHPEYWDLGFIEHSPLAAEYEKIVASIGDAIRFMETLAGRPVGQTDRVDFFTSHEGLHLFYEQAQTRQVPHREGWYNLSTHLPWIGMRTAQPEGAHVEFFRGVRNPIGIKIGPGMTDDWLRRLLDILHPDDEPGRLTLIHRFGADQVGEHLPRLIRAVRASGKTVVWCCDPMHGNTQKAGNGIKTRRFDDILTELEQAIDIHAAEGSTLGGVHFELTGDNVTECVGGARRLEEADLKRAYRSQVDPRLNCEQALEMAMLLAQRLSKSAARAQKAARQVASGG
jgi:3-deoxy-7-phosphoheptulonate synthase